MAKAKKRKRSAAAKLTEEQFAEVDRMLAMANTKLPAAYACIAKAVDSPEDGAMLALLIARHFCDMRLEPPLKLEQMVAVVANLRFVPSGPGSH